MLLALVGKPNSGIASRSATLVSRVQRRRVAQHHLKRSRRAAIAVQTAARGRLARERFDQCIQAVLALQAHARRHLCASRCRRCAWAVLIVQTTARAQMARSTLRRARRGALHIQAAHRRHLARVAYVSMRRAAQTLQRAVRRFLGALRAGPTRAMLRLQAHALQQRVSELQRELLQQRASGSTSSSATTILTRKDERRVADELEQQRQEVAGLRLERTRLLAKLEERDKAAAEVAVQHARMTRKLEGGFTHMIGANAVFEVPNFLLVDRLVCESHVFAAAGFEWKLWVKPFSGPDDQHVGLYLTPAADLDEAHTADYSLAIVGRQGHILSRELSGGRAKLQGCRAGHGWPTFVSRAEIEAQDPSDPASRLLHADGRLIVTCSGLANVRPREASDSLSRTM